MKELITIGIPTYNRKTEIFNQVEIIFNFIKNNSFENEIELVVIDNNSDFEIRDILKIFIDENKGFFKVFKNKSNIGMANNIIETMKYASGKFYYFIGDDDSLDLDAFRKTFKIIKSSNYDTQVIITGNDNLAGYKNLFSDINKNEFRFKKNLISILPIYYIGNANTFVSTKYLNEISDDRSLYLLNSYPIPHSALAVYNLKKNDSALLINTALLKKGAGAGNNVVTSWSLINTRFYFAYLLDKNFNLPKKNFLKRHPEINLFGVLNFLLQFILTYNFQDTNKERSSLKKFIIESKLSFLIKILLRISISKFIFMLIFIFIFIKNLLLKKKIITFGYLRNLYQEEKKRKLLKKNVHYWKSDFLF